MYIWFPPYPRDSCCTNGHASVQFGPVWWYGASVNGVCGRCSSFPISCTEAGLRRKMCNNYNTCASLCIFYTCCAPKCAQLYPIMFIFPQPVNIVERLPPGERPWLELQVVRPKQDKFGCGRGPKCKPTARNNAGKPPRLPLGCPCHEEMKFAEFSGRKGL